MSKCKCKKLPWNLWVLTISIVIFLVVGGIGSFITDKSLKQSTTIQGVAFSEKEKSVSIGCTEYKYEIIDVHTLNSTPNCDLDNVTIIEPELVMWNGDMIVKYDKQYEYKYKVPTYVITETPSIFLEISKWTFFLYGILIIILGIYLANKFYKKYRWE